MDEQSGDSFSKVRKIHKRVASHGNISKIKKGEEVLQASNPAVTKAFSTDKVVEHLSSNVSIKSTLSWSHLEDLYNSSEVKGDPLYDMLKFPDVCLRVVGEVRESSVEIGNQVGDRSKLTPFTRNCVDVITSDWVSIIGPDEDPEQAQASGSSFIASPRLGGAGRPAVPRLASPRDGGSAIADPAAVAAMRRVARVHSRDPKSPRAGAKSSVDHARKALGHATSGDPDRSPTASAISDGVRGAGVAGAVYSPKISSTRDSQPVSTVQLDESIIADPTRASDGLHDTETIDLFAFTPDSLSVLGEASRKNELRAPFPSKFAVAFELTIKDLQFKLHNFEPYFGSVAVYNLRKGQKLSETFHFDFWPDQDIVPMSDLPAASRQPDKETIVKSFFIALTEANVDTVLVFQVKRLMRPESEDSFITKMQRPETVKAKDLERLQKETRDLLSMGVTTTNFSFCAFPLFEENGKLKEATNLFADDMRPLPPGRASTDADLCELCSSQKELQKIKPLAGALTFDIRRLEDVNAVGGRVDVNNSCKDQALIRELQEFPATLRTPLIHFVNNLYVYPETASLKVKQACIQVSVSLMTSDGDPLKPAPLCNVYGQCRTSKFKTEGLSSVTYKDKRPHFTDEIKIALPVQLTGQCHLLFTFYNAPCSKKEKSTVLGYAFLPIYRDGRVVKNDRRTLNICQELMPHYLDPQVESSLRWHDNKKSVFTFRTRLVSSVHHTDENLMEFQKNCMVERAENIEVDFIRSNTALVALRNLQKIELSTSMAFFPVLLNTLFTIMCSCKSDNLVKEAFQAIIFILQSVDKCSDEKNASQNSLLLSYVKWMFHLPAGSDKDLYEELTRCWLFFLETSSTLKDFRMTWFLLDVIVKSMALKLFDPPVETPAYTLDASDPRALVSPRSGRQSDTGVHMRTTGGSMPPPLPPRADQPAQLPFPNLPHSSSGGSTEGPPRRWCNRYEFSLKPQYTGNRKDWFPEAFVANLKKLLRLVFSHSNIKSLDSLTSFPVFCKDLLGIMDRGALCDIIYMHFADADTSSSAQQNISAIMKFQFLKALAGYEWYLQLNCPLEWKSIESVETISMDCWKRHPLAGLLLHEMDLSLGMESKSARPHAIVTLRSLLKKHGDQYGSRAHMERIMTMYFPYVVMMINRSEQVLKFPTTEVDWLLCFLYILKHSSRDLLRSWWRQEIQKRQMAFLKLLKHSVAIFKDEALELDVALVVLDLITQYVGDFDEELNREGSQLLESVFNIIYSLLDGYDPSFLCRLFQNVAGMIVKFGKPLFIYHNNSFCELLSYHILRHCNSPHELVRSKASSVFFLLLQRNYMESNTISRMKVQSTVAISKAVGENLMQDCTCISASLEGILEHAMSCTEQPNMVQQISDLVKQLLSLLRYNASIADNAFDPDITADLYLQISSSYHDSPTLRVTWLDSLATAHAANENFQEAAMAKIFIASLVADYLNWSEHLPISRKDFENILPNVTSERGLPDLKSSQDEGLFSLSNYWSAAGFKKYITEAVELFDKGKMFELSIESESLLCMIQKHERNFPELSKCLSRYKKNVDRLIESGKELRLFCRYYRVGFYGELFGDLDGKEFVYKKDPKINLALMTQHLKEIYLKKLGETSPESDKIVVLPNTKPIDREGLDPKKLYLQIASVNPYTAEGGTGDSSFEPNFNQTKFIFELGATDTGKAHANDISKQQKKKIVFYTDIPFPYMTARVPVTRKETIILSPIENAIDLIKGRSAAMRRELNINPPRMNCLQQLLQGSVVPMVNEGPMRICEIFLGPGAEQEQYSQQHIKELKVVMDDFSKVCGFCVALNKSIIDQRHVQFQNMVEEHYKNLKARIRDICG